MWHINPCPKNLKKNKPIKSIIIEFKIPINKHVLASDKPTNKVNLRKDVSSINLPAQIKIKLLSKVAEEYSVPNSVFVKFISSLKKGLNIPIKNVCPKLEQNVRIKPKNKYLKLSLIKL